MDLLSKVIFATIVVAVFWVSTELVMSHGDPAKFAEVKDL
jgi:hypothetical protein